MFEAFAQGEQCLARPKGGLGPGLPLVKELVEMHGGSVSARSAGLGQGSEFVVMLPLESPTQTTIKEQQQPTSPNAGSRRVVIVEDNVGAAISLAELLEFEGHFPHNAGDGRIVIRMAHELLPAWCFAISACPTWSAALWRALRQEPGLASIQLVALSGYAQPEDRLRSRACGFDDHLAKPPDVKQLLQLITASGADGR